MIRVVAQSGMLIGEDALSFLEGNAVFFVAVAF